MGMLDIIQMQLDLFFKYNVVLNSYQDCCSSKFRSIMSCPELCILSSMAELDVSYAFGVVSNDLVHLLRK